MAVWFCGKFFYPKHIIDIYVTRGVCPNKKMAALKSNFFHWEAVIQNYLKSKLKYLNSILQ